MADCVSRVAGVTFQHRYPHNLTRLQQRLDGGETIPVALQHEPDNEYDANAIGVYANGEGKVGHLPRAVAKVVVQYIDEVGRAGRVCRCGRQHHTTADGHVGAHMARLSRFPAARRRCRL